MDFNILEKLSKDYILRHVSQQEIFSEFLGISLIEIENATTGNKLICSPLRTDNSPTCGFYYDKNYRLRFNDFAGYFHGDCFDAVAYQHNLNANDHQGFAICLDIIAKKFKLHKYNNDNVFLTTALPVRNTIDFDSFRINKTTVIEVQARGWNTADIKYWGNANVSTSLLDSLHVVPAYGAWINKQQVYYFKYDDPCYAYYFGDKNGIQQWKLYFPNRTKYKFLTNTKRLQGLNFAKNTDVGIITKSMKDVVVLKAFDIEAVAVAGETIEPSKAEISYLQAKWKTIYSLMDWDYTGIRMAQLLKRKYGIKPLFYTNGVKSLVDYNAKDTFEFVNFWGKDTFSEMVDFHRLDGLEQTFEYYKFIHHLLK